jgi:uncharacterized protein
MTASNLGQNAPLWTLLAAQIAMGGFDILFHHEITERLAWKPNAAQELRLHSARNALYAVLFGGLAWLQPTGFFAAVLIAILLVEIVITLWDFVEEDQTRRLPATERVLHTLLAINYGAILAIVMPVVGTWAGEPSGLATVSYGAGSLILSIAGLGCLGFALRDIATSRRAQRLVAAPPPQLAGLLTAPKRILVTGATGFVGKRLTAALAASGHEVVALVRSTANSGLLAPVTLITRLDQVPADLHLDAIVHLAGAPVAAGPWTLRRRLRILRSRLRITRAIHRFIAARPEALRPKVVVAASAIGFYGDRPGECLSEADASGAGFAAGTCRALEHEALKISALGVRVVSLRIGLVLSIWGGALGRMVPAFDLGLGGPIDRGRQWMSWIGLDDLVRLIAHAIACEDLDGAVNATAPNPLRNGEFTNALANALHRWAPVPVPFVAIRLGLGAMGRELLLASQRVMPVKVLATGFVFDTPSIPMLLERDLTSALRHRSPPIPAISLRRATPRATVGSSQ